MRLSIFFQNFIQIRFLFSTFFHFSPKNTLLFLLSGFGASRAVIAALSSGETSIPKFLDCWRLPRHLLYRSGETSIPKFLDFRLFRLSNQACSGETSIPKFLDWICIVVNPFDCSGETSIPKFLD